MSTTTYIQLLFSVFFSEQTYAIFSSSNVFYVFLVYSDFVQKVCGLTNFYTEFRTYISTKFVSVIKLFLFINLAKIIFAVMDFR